MAEPTTPPNVNWRRNSLLLAALAFVAVLVLWNVPELSGITYPFRLFVTTVHELGHGLSTILTGGEFLHYTVESNGAGLATTRGGARFIIIQAGYLGAAIFGAGLLILTNRTRYTKFLAVALGVGFALLILMYARSPIAFVWGLLFAALLIAIGAQGSPLLAAFTLNFLAITTGLNAVLDVLGLFNALNEGRIAGGNDAQSMADLTGIAAPLWALLWIALSIVLLGLAAYVTFWQPLRRANNRAAGES